MLHHCRLYFKFNPTMKSKGYFCFIVMKCTHYFETERIRWSSISTTVKRVLRGLGHHWDKEKVIFYYDTWPLSSYEIFNDWARKRWPFNTGDCLIEATSREGSTVFLTFKDYDPPPPTSSPLVVLTRFSLTHVTKTCVL